MPALNFKPEFIDKILTEEKSQTIRPTRKHPIKVGDRLYLYTGQRTKQCRKIGEAVCSKVSPIAISTCSFEREYRVILDGREMTQREIREISSADGFEDIKDFLSFFFEHKRSETDGVITGFTGQLIKWRGLIREAQRER